MDALTMKTLADHAVAKAAERDRPGGHGPGLLLRVAGMAAAILATIGAAVVATAIVAAMAVEAALRRS